MKPRVVLFLSRGVPLAKWDKIGLFEREVALYRRLQVDADISIVSSGNQQELAYTDSLEGMQILYNRWRIPTNMYSLLAPVLHWNDLRQADLYKTNQLDGAWTAVLAAKLHRKPLVVRAGYLWAENFTRQQGVSGKSRLIDRLQRFALRHATHIVVTTPAMKDSLADRYTVPRQKMSVIPNYVDTVQFGPDTTTMRENGRLCFIGRLKQVKNLDMLIDALAPLTQAHLVLIGQGEEQAKLTQLAAQRDVSVEFVGLLPHDQLPDQLNRSALFVLPSKFEGHPKALIEAMACGMAVLGADVEGIREVIRHGETGWLCPPTVAGLREAIQTLLSDAALRQRLGKNARQFVLDHFSLDRIVEQEMALYRHLLAERPSLQI